MTKLFTKASLCMILSLLEEQVNGRAIFRSIMGSVLLNPSTKNDIDLKNDVPVFLSNKITLGTLTLLSFGGVLLKFLFFSSYQSIFFTQYYPRLFSAYLTSVPDWLWNIRRFVSTIIVAYSICFL